MDNARKKVLYYYIKGITVFFFFRNIIRYSAVIRGVKSQQRKGTE